MLRHRVSRDPDQQEPADRAERLTILGRLDQLRTDLPGQGPQSYVS